MGSATLTKRLARLQNRPTGYEIVVGCPEKNLRYLLMYSTRWTRRNVTEIACVRMDDLTAVTHVDPNDWRWGDHVADPITARDPDGDLWLIQRSGRTQRQAYITGELAWVVDAAREGVTVG